MSLSRVQEKLGGQPALTPRAVARATMAMTAIILVPAGMRQSGSEMRGRNERRGRDARVGRDQVDASGNVDKFGRARDEVSRLRFHRHLPCERATLSESSSVRVSKNCD